jgi:DNA-binding NtrC family response regulator
VTNNNTKLVLVADDDEDIRYALSLLLSTHGYKVTEANSLKETVIQVERQKPDLLLLDMNFSRDTTSGEEGLSLLNQFKGKQIPIILMTAWGSVDLAVKGLRSGAVDFIEKPWNKDKLLNSLSLHIEKQALNQECNAYRQILSKTEDKPWVYQSKSMKAVEDLVNQIAPTDANILILGENGTGKSQLAQRIHQLSNRKESPFISVNMGAIPDTLFESELFGHQKGAFTDAKQDRLGRFQLANKGTIFLDEIGTLPLNLQHKLLRVLETGEFEPLGASKTSRTDSRVISATNANLQNLVSEGEFRQDLLYRLNTLVINLPPLRERLEDIKPLAEHFLALFSQKYQKHNMSLSDSAIKHLCKHTWPGNIRELSHVIERAVLIAPVTEVSEQQILLDQGQIQSGIQLQPLEQAERQLIEKAMQATDYNVIEAAKILDISRNALYRRLEKFDISVD